MIYINNNKEYDVEPHNDYGANMSNNENYYFEANTKRNKLKLILCIINCVVIVPSVIRFIFLWWLFGGLSDSKAMYYGLLCGSAIYLIISFVFLIKLISNVIKFNPLKKYFKIAIVLIISLFCLKYMFQTSNSLNNTPKIELGDNILLVTDDVEIKLEDINYTTNNIEVKFNLMNKSNKYYNFDIVDLKINDYYNVYFGIDSNSNFGIVNNWVKPNNNSNNYIVYIWYDDLEKYNIEKNEIQKLSFKLSQYISEKGDIYFNTVENDEYISVEVK